MKLSKKIAIILTAVGLISSAGIIKAAPSNTANNRMGALVTAIAQKFNLNASDVQAIVDQTEAAQRTQMQAQQQQRITENINQNVIDGKLTQDQANLILAKEQEVKSFMDSLTGKTQTERQIAINAEMNSIKQWATDNNIPQQYVSFGLLGFGGGHRGYRGFGMMNERPEAAGTVTAISGNTITLAGKDNVTYTIDASNATIKKIITEASANTPPSFSTIAVSEIKVGNNLKVQGAVTGTNIAATEITDGVFLRMMAGLHKPRFSGQ